MKKALHLLITAGVVVVFAGALNAQCKTWNDSPKKEEALDAHSVYRPYVKGKQAADLEKMDDATFNTAFESWKKAYDIAPAADGQRATHYSDGRLFYQAMMNKTTDAAKKKEYSEVMMRLYDEQIQCYQNEGFLLGRKAYDMFYMPTFGYSAQTMETFKKAVDKGGNNTEYIVFDPMAQVMVYLYKNKQLNKEDFRLYHDKLIEIAEYNVKNNQQYGQYYEAGRSRMLVHFAEVEKEVFDCEYFKTKLLPLYEKSKDSLETVKYIYVTLRQEGCDSTSQFMKDIHDTYEKLATVYNAKLEGELRAKNPGYDAAMLQKEGKYSQAVARYKEAIETDNNNDNRAQYYYSLAFIQTWEFGQYQAARDNARKAASLRPNWGRPYLLIGDMYAKTSRNCGDDWNSRLAIIAAIDKYAYARSIDSDVAGEANERIGNYSAALPDRQEGFMRGVNEGVTATVGCWIGETVKVRYK
ncbi:MAG: tetratricopeptide repeat protein [Saprospiraceae bacterium]|nr:tetratricopeptide repeat protein [Saprospiraceae bacterium]